MVEIFDEMDKIAYKHTINVLLRKKVEIIINFS